MARTGDSASDSDSDSELAGRWRRPLPSDDECDDAITLRSHDLRAIARDSNIVLNIRVMTPVAMTCHYLCHHDSSRQDYFCQGKENFDLKSKTF